MRLKNAFDDILMSVAVVVVFFPASSYACVVHVRALTHLCITEWMAVNLADKLNSIDLNGKKHRYSICMSDDGVPYIFTYFCMPHAGKCFWHVYISNSQSAFKFYPIFFAFFFWCLSPNALSIVRSFLCSSFADQKLITVFCLSWKTQL